MDNAVKFTENGSIDFGIEEIKVNEIILFVKDTGIGIEDDMYEKIFDRFRQVDMSATRMRGGNGLGLSIVKNLVEMLGGKIWVESKPGNGSCFTFSLPYEKETEPTRMDDKVAYANSDKQKPLNILLVEDDSISQMFIEEILEPINCKLVIAQNGKEALIEIEKNQFDLILMDIGLPDINGLDLVKEIRKTDKKIWIIAQTAFAMFSDEKNAQNAGCNDYIPKPIDAFQLLEKIEKLN
jgi:CheY-like chemotaxis protein